jgi:tripartite-type tricarboxylate transporter receptor subunit TctC
MNKNDVWEVLMTAVPYRMALGFMAVACAISVSTPAFAESVEEFYRSKTVSLYIPSAAGGGYDTYGRLIGRHIGRHIPGNPTIVPRNVPGAGGVIEANQLYTAAPKDGTAFGIIQHGIIFRPIFDNREVRYKIEGFRWLGSAAPIAVVTLAGKKANVKSAQELFEKELIVGAGGGTTEYMPATINSVLGTKMKIIKGYKGNNEILLAIERGEVEAVSGIGLDTLGAAHAAVGREYNYLFQMGATRAPELPDVPLIQDFAKNPDDKAVLEAVFASLSIGRSFVTPVIPEDRLAALRKAFKATTDDPQLLAEAKKSSIDVKFVDPEEIHRITARVYGLPEPILKRVAAAMQEGG